MYWTCERSWSACPDTDGLLRSAWRAKLNSPQTSAAGRVFDAAAALIVGATHTSFEAEGPMLLESLCAAPAAAIDLPLLRDATGILRSDWEPLLDVIADNNRSRAARAEVFHSSMAQVVLRQAQKIRKQHDVSYVGLCGGVFQNRVLTEQAAELLRHDAFDVVLPRSLPCNDAGLSFGQAAELAARKTNR
jgi:hydrogenase maturation protein HypF